MIYPDSFKVTTPSDLEIQVVRDFHAPRRMVFDAFTRPELVSRWMLGPQGWTMPLCEIDLRVGGAYRYVWRDADGSAMHMGGLFREVLPAERLVVTERFLEAWYPGEALNTTVFTQDGDVTRVKITMLYETKAARDTARVSGMEEGMAAGFERLEGLLPSQTEN